MKLHLDKSNSPHRIHSCTKNGNGFEIKIDDQSYACSLIIAPHKLINWGVGHPSQLRPEDFKTMAGFNPEVVILGTGPAQEFINPKTYLPLIEAGIGLEVMDTQAACRTYNVLISDDRNIVAALIL